MAKRRLKLMLMLMIITSIFYIKTYAVTLFNTANHVVVIYKILDPLTVTVDKPEKLTVSGASMEPFTYSKTSLGKKPINIKVSRPFNNRDNILDAIFSKVTLEIQNQGVFELTEIKDTKKKLKAKGYFSDTKDYKTIIPLSAGGGHNKYEGDANLDVEFNNGREKIELGTYKGVLRVDVLYGG